ncbi:MAG: LdpA C-terminal domain-containing domain [Cyanobacteria bacterium P01_C01_bin.72]
MQSYPLQSLKKGSWFKLICGASYQHLPAVRSLALAYSLAGADCIDVAADPAVITAAKEGIMAARQQLKIKGLSEHQPWLMVSINDGVDPHFRKAKFDASQCPSDCPQPCVKVCPASAIDLSWGGVRESLCYGCGRCEPICPRDLIANHSYVSNLAEVIPLVDALGIDAIEIHTQVGRKADFKRVWQEVSPIIQRLKLLAISCTDAPNIIEYLRSLYELVSPLPCPLIWQTDGRSMSGDIGKGTTHATINLAQKVLKAELPGYIQLAGGTNDYTVRKLKQAKLLGTPDGATMPKLSGLAYGSYARAILSPTIALLETALQPVHMKSISAQSMNQPNLKLEHHQELLEQAVTTAQTLVKQIKTAHTA